jgi:C-terminal processing protease CtpA/Prc
MRIDRHLSSAVLLASLSCAPSLAFAQSDVVLQRLAVVGTLWADVTFAHPWLSGSTAAWDAATIVAIDAALKAPTDTAFTSAIAMLLATLDDPATTLVAAAVPGDPTVTSSTARFAREGHVGVLQVGDPLATFDPKSQSAFAEASRDTAVRLVLDLRGAVPPESYGTAILGGALEQVLRSTLDTTVIGGAERRRIAYGFEQVGAFGSGQYRRALETGTPPLLTPLSAARSRELVVVLNRYSVVPPALGALQRVRRAKVVVEGAVGLAIAREHPLPDGTIARVRIADLVLPDGTSGEVVADTVVASGRGIETARTMGWARSASVAARVGPATAPRLALTNPRTGALPDRATRIFAALKFWHVIERHSPYLDLLDTPWAASRDTLVRAFTAAEDSLAYARAMADAARRLHDGHAYVAGGSYTSTLLPSGMPAVRVRFIEGRPIVTRIFNPSTAAGVRVGDEVLQVAGLPVNQRITELRTLISASTPWGLDDKVGLSLLAGPVGDSVRVVLQGETGVPRALVLPRHHEDYTTLYHRERDTDIIREVAPGIGYVDLDRLEFGQVDSVFSRFADADAIILDMRGYPNGTVWQIAPRLAERPAVVARFLTPAPGLPSPEPGSLAFVQQVIPDADPARRFRGRTVMLMDERSQSQAEHTGLWLRAANGTVFVGGPTAGANGEITGVSLPGGYTIGFTGQQVTWPNGSQLQRRGLQPDVAAAPTVAGIRNGRDEVLEAAIATVLRR